MNECPKGFFVGSVCDHEAATVSNERKPLLMPVAVVKNEEAGLLGEKNLRGDSESQAASDRLGSERSSTARDN